MISFQQQVKVTRRQDGSPAARTTPFFSDGAPANAPTSSGDFDFRLPTYKSSHHADSPPSVFHSTVGFGSSTTYSFPFQVLAPPAPSSGGLNFGSARSSGSGGLGSTSSGLEDGFGSTTSTFEAPTPKPFTSTTGGLLLFGSAAPLLAPPGGMAIGSSGGFFGSTATSTAEAPAQASGGVFGSFAAPISADDDDSGTVTATCMRLRNGKVKPSSTTLTVTAALPWKGGFVRAEYAQQLLRENDSLHRKVHQLQHNVSLAITNDPRHKNITFEEPSVELQTEEQDKENHTKHDTATMEHPPLLIPEAEIFQFQFSKKQRKRFLQLTAPKKIKRLPTWKKQWKQLVRAGVAAAMAGTTFNPDEYPLEMEMIITNEEKKRLQERIDEAFIKKKAVAKRTRGGSIDYSYYARPEGLGDDDERWVSNPPSPKKKKFKTTGRNRSIDYSYYVRPEGLGVSLPGDDWQRDADNISGEPIVPVPDTDLFVLDFTGVEKKKISQTTPPIGPKACLSKTNQGMLEEREIQSTDVSKGRYVDDDDHSNASSLDSDPSGLFKEDSSV